MKKVLKIVFLILTVAAFFAFVAFTCWARFAHPQLTETTLFLTYWKQWAGLIAAILLLYFIYGKLDIEEATFRANLHR